VEIIEDINSLIGKFSSKKRPVFFSLDWHVSTHCSFGFNGTAQSNPGYFNPNGAFAGPLVEGKTTEADYPGLKDLCLDQRTQRDFRNTNLGVMQWPKHCVQQTFGSRFYPFLKVPKDAQVIKKGVEISKDAYSAFDGFMSKQSFPFDTEDTAVDLTSRSSLETLLRNQNVERLYIVGIATDYCVKSSAVDGKALGFLKEVSVLVPLTRWVSSATKEAAIAEMKAAGVTISDKKSV
jgi:nicotinamidase-related amidase